MKIVLIAVLAVMFAGMHASAQITTLPDVFTVSGATATWRNTGVVSIGYGTPNQMFGDSDTSVGWEAYGSSTGGLGNTAVGSQALYSTTYGNENTAVGDMAGYVAGDAANISGYENTWIGAESGTTATDLTNATAIGYGALTTVSNQVVLGDSDVTQTVMHGTQIVLGTAPVASLGTITGTNAGGYITGLSSATSATLTFANSGWNTWASCVVTPDSSITVYVSSISKTTVTFASSSGMSTLYYHCDGN